MKALNLLFSFCLTLVLITLNSCLPEPAQIPNSTHARVLAQYRIDLDRAIVEAEKIIAAEGVQEKQQQFKTARLAFKRAELIMALYGKGAYHALNMAPLPKVDEVDNAAKVVPPTGFQVLEEALFADQPDKEAVLREARNIINTLKLERANNKLLAFQDHHLLWAVRDELLRILSLGISGFDSPVIAHSLAEATAALDGIQTYFSLYKERFKDPNLAQQWDEQIQRAKRFLQEGKDFNSFDRYTFTQKQLHPMLQTWKETVEDWQVKFPFEQKVNYEASSFFASSTFNREVFAPRNTPKSTPGIIALGKKLFHDKRLSSSGKMSCGSCHQPAKAFTDGQPKAIGNNNKPVLRNAPTIMYAGLQASQFYDARASTLEGQILDVVNNEEEFNHSIEEIVKYVQGLKECDDTFLRLYGKPANSKNIRQSIAIYERSLAPLRLAI